MKFGVLVFPGSNCDHDTFHALHDIAGQPATLNLKPFEVVTLELTPVSPR